MEIEALGQQRAEDETHKDRDAARARDAAGVLAPPAGLVGYVEAQAEFGG